MTNYQDHLIENVGGQTLFNLAMMNYCESIRSDHKIAIFFAHLDLSDLINLQKELLKVAFVDSTTPDETEAVVIDLMEDYQVVLMRMHEGHFDAMKGHFLLALRHAWLEEFLVQDVEKQYDTLRPLFQHDIKVVSRPYISHQRPSPIPLS